MQLCRVARNAKKRYRRTLDPAMKDASDNSLDSGNGPKSNGDGLEKARLCESIADLLDHVAPLAPDVEYRLIGTAAAAVRGVRLPVNDIDLLFRRNQDLDRVAAALSTLPASQCLFSPGDAGGPLYFARYLVDGMGVDLSLVKGQFPSDTAELFGTGAWEHYGWVCCSRHSVPVVTLELRLLNELERNRRHRYRAIAAHLGTGRCDMDFIHRGLADANLGIPEKRQREVLKILGAAGNTTAARGSGIRDA